MSSSFGPNWHSIESLDEGGQGHLFSGIRVGDPSNKRYALKRLKNLTRQPRFLREIEAIQRLDHPNILALNEQGVDTKGRPFFVTELIDGGSLAKSDVHKLTETQKFELFGKVCLAVEFAHSQGVIHRDIKPENIFLREPDDPVLGDFGICYVEDNGELTMTEEVMGSRFYCAPELRDGRTRTDIPQELADIYSLGKVLYWIFSKRVFDREDTYQNTKLGFELANSDTVVRPVQQMMAAALVDDLVSESVVADPSQRQIKTAKHFRARVTKAADRVRVFGRPLDLRLPKRCLFCGEGEYKPLHERTDMPLSGPTKFPSLADRRTASPNPSIPTAQDPFARLRDAGDSFIFRSQRGFPLYLVCSACGNVQYFRLDLTDDRHGEKWRPQ